MCLFRNIFTKKRYDNYNDDKTPSGITYVRDCRVFTYEEFLRVNVKNKIFDQHVYLASNLYYYYYNSIFLSSK